MVGRHAGRHYAASLTLPILIQVALAEPNLQQSKGRATTCAALCEGLPAHPGGYDTAVNMQGRAAALPGMAPLQTRQSHPPARAAGSAWCGPAGSGWINPGTEPKQQGCGQQAAGNNLHAPYATTTTHAQHCSACRQYTSSTAQPVPRGTSPGLWRSDTGPHRPWPPSRRCWQPAHPASQAGKQHHLICTPRLLIAGCTAGSGSSSSCTRLHQGQQALRGRQLVQLCQQVWQHLQGRNVLPLLVLPAAVQWRTHKPTFTHR